jgi:hypothetical protein
VTLLSPFALFWAYYATRGGGPSFGATRPPTPERREKFSDGKKTHLGGEKVTATLLADRRDARARRAEARRRTAHQQEQRADDTHRPRQNFRRTGIKFRYEIALDERFLPVGSTDVVVYRSTSSSSSMVKSMTVIASRSNERTPGNSHSDAKNITGSQGVRVASWICWSRESLMIAENKHV